ncbi:MAG: hypothetical protein ACI87E_004670, partial [Mariniblastus sp.]
NPPSIDGTFEKIGTVKLTAGQICWVEFDAALANGVVCVDFVQLLPVGK